MKTTIQTPRHIALALARRERLAAIGKPTGLGPWPHPACPNPDAPHVVAALARRERLAAIGAAMPA